MYTHNVHDETTPICESHVNSREVVRARGMMSSTIGSCPQKSNIHTLLWLYLSQRWLHMYKKWIQFIDLVLGDGTMVARGLLSRKDGLPFDWDLCVPYIEMNPSTQNLGSSGMI